MSENTFEENNLFRDYKTDNFDDSDLQSRLYAEIYYESNVEDEPKNSDISGTIQFDSITVLNTEPEGMQQKSEDKQPLESETAKGKSSKACKKISKEYCNRNTQLSNVTSIIDSLMCDDTLQAQNSADCPPSVEIQTNTDELLNKEMNPVIHDNAGNSSAEEGKRCKEVAAKDKASTRHRNIKLAKRKYEESSSNNETALMNEMKHSKYNVLSKSTKQEMSLAKQFKKNKEASDSSDSDESIFEVPIAPKPKPPLINLQDSDEENKTNSEMDSRISEKITSTTSHEITGASSSHQDTSCKNKSTDKSSHNKNTIVKPKSTRVQEIREDIVLNCTIVQRGAKSINEIKQMAKSAELNKNQRCISTGDTNKNSTQPLSQNTSKENNANFQQETFITPRYSDTGTEQTRYNLRSTNKNKTDEEASCSNSGTTIDRKRQFDNRIESPKQKRQCIVQPNNQNVTQQNNNNEEKRNEFQSMPDALRKFYYDSSRGQENFDVSELQRGMSRDPRMWKILDEDLMPCPRSKQRNRFWNIRCSNCQRDGHQRYDCPVPRRTPCCYICGEKGHVESRCPQKLCLTCGKQQNTFRKTCEHCRVLYCTMCHSVGHESMQCPDLWRRYHQTTDTRSFPQNPGNVMKPPSLLHCCNCTKRGHESFTCREYRWSQHFQTPAAVTNYTNGPMYPTSFSDDIYEEEIQSVSATSSSKIMQQTMKEHSEFSTSNVDTLASSSARANETSIEGTMRNLEIEGNLESPSMVNRMPKPEGKQKIHRPNEIKFNTVIYSYGKFFNKDHENGWVITRDFSLLKNDLSVHGKRTVTHSLPKRKIEPVFLKTLFGKAIEFEVKIGTTSRQKNQAVVLQVVAMKEYVELIYNLLLHWINLQDNEKDYGLDVTLSMNPTKMFNLLSSRMPKFAKMSFISYAENIRNTYNDPRWLHNSIKHMKIVLEQHKNSSNHYFTLRKKLWREQVRLLMIVNTEPAPIADISELQEAMKQLEFKKQDQTIEKLDPTTYLKFTLLFNRLFVPHTPADLPKTLRRFKKHAERISYSLLKTQKIKQNKMYEPENLSAIDIQQGTSNETLIDRRDVIDISPEISVTVNCDEKKVMLKENSVAQDSPDIIPLNTEALNYIEPISISMEHGNEEQLLLSDDTECNMFANELTIKAIDMRYLTNNEKGKMLKLSPQDLYTSSHEVIDLRNLSKKERKRVRRNLRRKGLDQNTSGTKQLTKKQRKKQRERLEELRTEDLYQKASYLIEEARTLKQPHLMSAADELQKKMNDKTIRTKHYHAMNRMIKFGRKYQRKVSSFWEDLQA